MIKKCFRPFWSYDVQETEKWLSDMAGQGWHLVSVDFLLRVFRFEKGESAKVVFRIQYARFFDGSLPKGLAKAGWEISAYNKHWCVFCSMLNGNRPNCLPARDSLIGHITTMQYVWGTVLGLNAIPLFSIMSSLPAFLLIGLFMIGSPKMVKQLTADLPIMTNQSFWFVIFLLSILAGIFVFIAIYLFVKVSGSNKSLKIEVGYYYTIRSAISNMNSVKTNFIKKAIRTNLIIETTRLFWMDSPDHTETWLEKMAEQGFQLYHLSGYKFYLIRTVPTKTKYCLDYQEFFYPDYYTTHQNSGWVLLYAATSSKWSIWMKSYSQNDCTPEMYNNKSDVARKAKKYATARSIQYGFSCAFYTACLAFPMVNLIHKVDNLLLQTPRSTELPEMFFFAICCFLGSIFLLIVLLYIIEAIKPILYYLRIKKKVNL
jgi:hypothetical protein